MDVSGIEGDFPLESPPISFNFVGIQSPSENGNGTYILCIAEVIGHPNHLTR